MPIAGNAPGRPVLAFRACAYFGLILAGLINGLDRVEVLDPNWEPLSKMIELHPLHPKIAQVADGSFRENGPPDVVGSGYVVQSLEAALWAFHDDADTTGAVCGQLAGAYWGESGIPAEWLEGLAR